MKNRIDTILTDRGYFESREQAKRSIMAGLVFVNNVLVDKPGTTVPEDAEIEVKSKLCPYVSRGGFKLAKAIQEFGINCQSKICIDIGASTGGFTDCMLKNGASKVYAIDVGYGQLDYSLRIDPRVINIEKTNIRYLDTDNFPEKADLISIDVSFISLKLIFPVATKLLKSNGQLVSLIKPQFEAGREQVGKKGIVRDLLVHEEVINNVIKYALDNNLTPTQIDYSPVTGTKGNIEYIMLCEINDNQSQINNQDIINIINEAHQTLAK